MEKMFNIENFMVNGLGYSEKGWKPIKTSTLKKINVENPSDVFYLETEKANEFKSNLTVGKDKIEILAELNIEDFITEVIEVVGKARKKGERAGTLADTRAFIEKMELTDKFKEFLLETYK